MTAILCCCYWTLQNGGSISTVQLYFSVDIICRLRNIREIEGLLNNIFEAVSSKCIHLDNVKMELKTKYLHFGSLRSVARHIVTDVT